MPAQVTVYVTGYCPYCTRAKSLLSSKNVAFSEVNVETRPELRHWLIESSRQRTVPQIYVNGQPLGGFTELAALDRQAASWMLCSRATPRRAIRLSGSDRLRPLGRSRGASNRIGIVARRARRWTGRVRDSLRARPPWWMPREPFRTKPGIRSGAPSASTTCFVRSAPVAWAVSTRGSTARSVNASRSSSSIRSCSAPTPSSVSRARRRPRAPSRAHTSCRCSTSGAPTTATPSSSWSCSAAKTSASASAATVRLELDDALDIGAQILRGLARAHEAGIVHRDLKPENVFLVERDDHPAFVKILDFGVSKIRAGARAAGGSGARGISATITREGVVVGTPLYMSPEQAQGLPGVDARSDLFSVGAILYECLTGQAASLRRQLRTGDRRDLLARRGRRTAAQPARHRAHRACAAAGARARGRRASPERERAARRVGDRLRGAPRRAPRPLEELRLSSHGGHASWSGASATTAVSTASRRWLPHRARAPLRRTRARAAGARSGCGSALRRRRDRRGVALGSGATRRGNHGHRALRRLGACRRLAERVLEEPSEPSAARIEPAPTVASAAAPPPAIEVNAPRRIGSTCQPKLRPASKPGKAAELRGAGATVGAALPTPRSTSRPAGQVVRAAPTQTSAPSAGDLTLKLE
jgi:glutaredoxin